MEQGLEDEADDVDAIFVDVAEGLEACRDLIAPIGDTLHDLRRRARTVIAGWQRAGLPAELVDLRLAPYDHWRGDTAPKVLVLFETLGEDLRRSVEELRLETSPTLEQELDAYRPALMERHANRIALADRGASGTIDQLALNAIARFGDVAGFLRQYARSPRHWLPDSTAVHMRHGHVEAGTGISTGAVEWYGDSMIFVTTTFVSQAELDDAVGKPAMTLLDHPFLCPEILVSSTESSFEDERQFVSVTFNMPRRWFCNVTGRVWDDETSGPTHAAVLPFGRRAR